MKIQYFVFNYAHFNDALDLFNGFSIAGCDVYLLNCESPLDPPFDGTDKIIKFPNIYYTGQWNEALKLLTGDVAFLVNSDVKIKSIPRLVYKMEAFYNRFGEEGGIYAPNLWWTPWTYDPNKLANLGNGLKKVPATDSTVWSVNAAIAHKIGQINLAVNKLGWGIEIVAAYYCWLQGKHVVRDYSIKCDHPQHTSYDRGEADRTWRQWALNIGLSRDFWNYYDSRNRYGFGWTGDDSYHPSSFEKMML